VVVGVYQRVRLNSRQVAVLARIDAREHPVTARDSELAVTVYALRTRGLVTTPRTPDGWRAEITDAGQFYLTNGKMPDDRGHEPLADRLVRWLRDNGGTFQVEDPDEDTRDAYQTAVREAKHRGLVPSGWRLELAGRDHGQLTIRLRTDPQLPTSR